MSDPDDVSMLYQAPAGEEYAAVPAGQSRKPPAHTLSGLGLIRNSVGVQFSQIAGTWAIADKASFGSAESTVPWPAIELLVPGILIAAGLLGRKHVD
jgi:hypothetical protein